MGLVRRFARTAVPASALSALVALACSDGGSGSLGPAAGTAGMPAAGGTVASGGTGGGTPSTPGGQFLLDYAEAVCGMYEPCCTADGAGFDQAGCVSWFSRVTDAYLTGEYDAELGAACLAAVADAAAADPDRCSNVAVFDDATFWEQCQDAFPIVREGAALGEVCQLAGDCASSTEGPVLCYGGRCLLHLEGAPGDGPCVIRGSENRPLEAYTCAAENGVFCDERTNTCEPHVATGEYCPFTSACDPEAALCSGGMCVPLGAEGEPCANGIQGAGGFCRRGLVCNRTTLLCDPGKAEAEACKDGECITGVCIDGLCKTSDYSKNLNCTG